MINLRMFHGDIGTLREMTADDVEMIRNWRNHPDVSRFMYNRHEITHTEHVAWWAKVKEDKTKRNLIYERSGVALGFVGFYDIDTANNSSKWGFYAAPTAPLGSGVFVEFLALRYAFKSLKLNKLVGEVLAFNTRAIRLHKEFGFVEEGLLRNQHWYDGLYVNIHVFGMLSNEWDETMGLMVDNREPI
jgi:UDP-4-amino-4,6-dideoxy-N-acetyl-beta-L-altrosamine N-acetyltransferase